MTTAAILGALLVLSCTASCPGNGQHPDVPATGCDGDAILDAEARLWRDLLQQMEGVQQDCQAPAIPMNAWLDEHEQTVRTVTADLERCNPRQREENSRLFTLVMLTMEFGCAPGTPVFNATKRFERASGVTSIPIRDQR